MIHTLLSTNKYDSSVRSLEITGLEQFSQSGTFATVLKIISST